MALDKKKRRALSREQEELRERHAQWVKKVAKAQKKWYKRSQKLQALEAEMARLTDQARDPEAERLGQAPGGDKHLRKARLIYNQNSGGSANYPLDRVIECLRTHGIVAEVALKTSSKAARQLAKESADRGDELVIVAAGDGTIEDVASQLVQTKTTLGILPSGTMNNLARCLGIPTDLDQACALIGMGAVRTIDVGRVLVDAKPQVQYFLETAGVGLSAIAVPAGQSARKRHWSDLPQALRKIMDFQTKPVTVELDGGETLHVNSAVVTVSNAPMMGMNIAIAPDAKMDDGLLDVAVYENMSKPDLLGYFLASMNGKEAANPNVKIHRTRHVRIHSDQPLDVHSDKDVIEGQEVVQEEHLDKAAKGNGAGQSAFMLDIEVIPNALSVIVGNGSALSLPVETLPTAKPDAAGNEKQETKPEPQSNPA